MKASVRLRGHGASEEGAEQVPTQVDRGRHLEETVKEYLESRKINILNESV